jgi:hypothetical protein
MNNLPRVITAVKHEIHKRKQFSTANDMRTTLKAPRVERRLQFPAARFSCCLQSSGATRDAAESRAPARRGAGEIVRRDATGVRPAPDAAPAAARE